MNIVTENLPSAEREYVRGLVKRYIEYASSDEMNERRRLWSNHNALEFSKPLIYIRAIPFNEFFDQSSLKCTEPFLRSIEYSMRFAEYRRTIADDFIEEPFFTVRAAVNTGGQIWGLPCSLGERPINGAAAFKPSLIEEEDFEKLRVLPHTINETATDERFCRMAELVGDIAPVYVNRQGSLCDMWQNDISTSLAKLRGLEQIMWDAYDRPEWLHRLLAFMRDSILKNMDETERAGDFSLLCHQNQAMPYIKGLSAPGGGAASQNQLWGFMAAQEFTGFGPDMYKEFMFDYQKPILERYAVTAYGCCEDLTQKIDILKTLKNLRRIAVTPFSDLSSCAEQIGSDYVLSWRPNPSDMVSRGVDEAYVRKYIRWGIDIMKQNNCKFDITLKDVETVAGDPNALIFWTSIVRDELNRAY